MKDIDESKARTPESLRSGWMSGERSALAPEGAL